MREMNFSGVRVSVIDNGAPTFESRDLGFAFGLAPSDRVRLALFLLGGEIPGERSEEEWSAAMTARREAEERALMDRAELKAWKSRARQQAAELEDAHRRLAVRAVREKLTAEHLEELAEQALPLSKTVQSRSARHIWDARRLLECAADKLRRAEK